MTTTIRSAPIEAPPRARRRVRGAEILAACALPLLAYQLWTLIGWVANGPHQVTEFRDRESASWVAARVIEAALVGSMIAIATVVIRDCRRRRRVTFDAMLIVGMTTAAFWDPIYNWVVPAWMYSSNWVNVNDWFAHAPLVLNPEAGQMPWPIAPVVIGYAFWALGFAVLDNLVMRRVARRRPSLPKAALAAVAFALSGSVTVVAFAIFRTLDLMHAPGYRVEFLGGSELIVFFYSGGLVFGAISCLRYFTDADGVTLTERGLDHLRPARRTATALLATVAACQLIVVVGWGLLTVPLSLYSAPYPETPAHLINGLCDAPGVPRTDYGPCPGSPGFRVPIR